VKYYFIQRLTATDFVCPFVWRSRRPGARLFAPQGRLFLFYRISYVARVIQNPYPYRQITYTPVFIAYFLVSAAPLAARAFTALFIL